MFVLLFWIVIALFPQIISWIKAQNSLSDYIINHHKNSLNEYKITYRETDWGNTVDFKNLKEKELNKILGDEKEAELDRLYALKKLNFYAFTILIVLSVLTILSSWLPVYVY